MSSCQVCGQKRKWIQIAKEANGNTLGVRPFALKGFEPSGIEGWVDISSFQNIKNPAPGIYCGGCFTPMESEESDDFMHHSSLADNPLMFTNPEQVDLHKVISSIRKTYGKSVLAEHDSDFERPAQRINVDELVFLSNSVRDAIKRKLPEGMGIYRHQKTAIETLVSGQNVIIATDTSSGKSLCFQAAILQNAAQAHAHGLEQPTALYMGPLNALVDDQFKSLSEVADKVSPGDAWRAAEYGFFKRLKLTDGTKIGLAQYHGGVSIETDPNCFLTSALRKSIRQEQPEVLFTNPEMLGRAILPLAIDEIPPGVQERKKGAGQWSYFFKRLSLVIIDECHEFRGVFGSHMANLIRRIRRICRIVGNDRPIRFALCSATIRTPEAFGEKLIGEKIDKVIDRAQDTSERYPKKILFINKENPGQPIRQFAKGIIGMLIEKQRLHTIAFQESIPSVQAIHNELKKSLKTKGLPENIISVFAANFLPNEKSEMLKDLRLRKTKAIVSTSALSLGIDIGSLSASILITYPGTISKAWQMLGRAGRRGPGLQIFLVGENFLDQYWAKNALEFVNRDDHLEEMIINPDNEYVLEEHIIAANYDYPLDLRRDQKFFGHMFEQVLAKVTADDQGSLIKQKDNSREVFIFRDGQGKKTFEISLRGSGKFKVPVYEHKLHGCKILEEDQVRAIRTLYPGAIFIHGGKFWQISSLSYERGNYGKNARFYAVAHRAAEDEVITVPEVKSEITVETMDASSCVGLLQKNFGRVSITTKVDNYYLVPYEPDKEADEQGMAQDNENKKPVKRLTVRRKGSTPSEYEYSTEGLWLEVPAGASAGLASEELEKALFTAGKAIVKAIPLHHYASPEDIRFEVFLGHPATNDNAAIFLYENQAGGVGLARRTYEIIDNLIKEAYEEVLIKCPRCIGIEESKGCPSCVADVTERHDRQLGIEILKEWVETIGNPHRNSRKPTKPTQKQIGIANRRAVNI
jgi:DEAD/DEAH box helicase domain-containing protein